MHRHRRRDRRPPASRKPRPTVLPGTASAGADVVLVGYFSAKQKDFAARMDSAAADLAEAGARVVGRVVQRRGVSNGGARKMGLPYSSRTLIGSGKAREVAALCEESGADVVAFLNPLTDHQQRVLTRLFGRPTVSLADMEPTARASSRETPVSD